MITNMQADNQSVSGILKEIINTDYNGRAIINIFVSMGKRPDENMPPSMAGVSGVGGGGGGEPGPEGPEGFSSFAYDPNSHYQSTDYTPSAALMGA